MKEQLTRFFSGRNGTDQLCRFLSWAALALMLLGMLTFSGFTSMGIMVYIYSMYRMLSKNLYKRSKENEEYLRLSGQVRGWFLRKKQHFTQRKTHHFYKCPNCKQTLRVPKGKGKISITCPSCRTRFEKKS